MGLDLGKCWHDKGRLERVIHQIKRAGIWPCLLEAWLIDLVRKQHRHN